MKSVRDLIWDVEALDVMEKVYSINDDMINISDQGNNWILDVREIIRNDTRLDVVIEGF